VGGYAGGFENSVQSTSQSFSFGAPVSFGAAASAAATTPGSGGSGNSGGSGGGAEWGGLFRARLGSSSGSLLSGGGGGGLGSRPSSLDRNSNLSPGSSLDRSGRSSHASEWGSARDLWAAAAENDYGNDARPRAVPPWQSCMGHFPNKQVTRGRQTDSSGSERVENTRALC